MEKSEMQKKVLEDPDFIHAPKFQNSLQKFLAKSENIPENCTIGRLLLMSAGEVEAVYLQSVEELKKEMVEDEEDRDL